MSADACDARLCAAGAHGRAGVGRLIGDPNMTCRSPGSVVLLWSQRYTSGDDGAGGTWTQGHALVRCPMHARMSLRLRPDFRAVPLPRGVRT